MPAVSAEFTCCNPSSPIRSKSTSSTFDAYKVPTPTLPPSLLKDKVKEKGGLYREDAEEDKEEREGLALERILAAIKRESGNVEFKKYSRLMNVVHAFLREGGAKAKDAEPISLEDTADEMMDVIFDIKEQITNDQYLSLSNSCRTIYEAGPKPKNATAGIREDGGITICPSNLLNFLEYITNMNVARMLHKEILQVQNQISNLSEEAEKVSGSARKKIETEILKCKSMITNIKVEHSKLMMKGKFYISEMKSIAENDDTLVRLIHSGACNMAYMLMFNSRKRKRN